MEPNQIIDQIWMLRWDEVIHVAFVDDWIVLVKIWPAILTFIILVVGFLLIALLNKKAARQKKLEWCFKCDQLFYNPDGFLDDSDMEDTIIITDKINTEFIISIHRPCAIKWANGLLGVGMDVLALETSHYLGKRIADHIKKKYKDINYLQVKVDTHGKTPEPNKILWP